MKQVFRGLRIAKLDQPALAADVSMERVDLFRLIEVLRPNVFIGNRRHAKIHKSVMQGGVAKPAVEFAHKHTLSLFTTLP